MSIAPAIGLLSTTPVRLAALQAVMPGHVSPEAATLLIMDASNGMPPAPATQALTIVLSPERPPSSPHAHWLATPCSPATLQQHITRLWQERPRRLHGHQLHHLPPGWEAPDGSRTALSDKEARLLAALIDAPNGLTRDALLEMLWGMDGSAVETHALETQLYRLRQKLQPHWGEAWFLGLREGICLLQPPGAA